MLKHSILAAGGCGVFKAIVPIPKAEVGALTCIINSFAANATTLVGGVFRGDISLHSLNIISNNKTKNLA